jgi:hypothetical protein
MPEYPEISQKWINAKSFYEGFLREIQETIQKEYAITPSK